MTRQDLRNTYPTFTAAAPISYSPATAKPVSMLRTLAYLLQCIAAVALAHMFNVI